MNLKQLAGERAVSFVEDGMVVGLGTGSTAYYAIRKLGELVRQGMKIKGVSTSKETGDLAREHGIPVKDDPDLVRMAVSGILGDGHAGCKDQYDRAVNRNHGLHFFLLPSNLAYYTQCNRVHFPIMILIFLI